MKKPVANKSKVPGRVKVRLLPGRGIGGIGGPGTEAWINKAEADQYVADGYVEIIQKAKEQADEPVKGEQA
jgi:hypothetical protein